MKVSVLRPFMYGADGINGRRMEVGEDFDCRDDLVPGLTAAGLVRAPAATKAVKPDPFGGEPVSVESGASVVHKGRGRYAIVVEGDEIESGLTREEALAKVGGNNG